MEERARFVAAGLGSLDQGGGRLIGKGHALFFGPVFSPNPNCGGAVRGGLAIEFIGHGSFGPFSGGRRIVRSPNWIDGHGSGGGTGSGSIAGSTSTRGCG
jgi:hypothetical protein